MLQYCVLLILISRKHSDCASGVSRNTQTAQSHIAAVHFWMPEGLTGQALQDLQQLGRKDGDVDRHLKEMRQVIKNIPTQPTKARDKLIYHRMKQEPNNKKAEYA